MSHPFPSWFLNCINTYEKDSSLNIIIIIYDEKWDKIFFIYLFLYSQSRIRYIILSLIMISYVYINNIGSNISNTRENVKVLRAQQRMHFYFVFQILEEDDLMKRNIYLFLEWYENIVFKCCLYSILKTFNLYSMDFRKKIK